MVVLAPDAGIGSGTRTSGKYFAVPVPALAPAPALWIFRRRCLRRHQAIFTGFGPQNFFLNFMDYFFKHQNLNMQNFCEIGPKMFF